MENISKINKQFDIFGLVHRYLYIVPISDSWGIEFQRVPISDSWDFEIRIEFQRVPISDSWDFSVPTV